jgi:hypothetical protein
MSARIRYSAPPGIFEKAFLADSQMVVEAAHDAIAMAGDIVKREAQNDIAASGFGQGFVNAMRVDIYPRGRKSINASAHIYHKIPYAGVFEEGATIRGKPRLWLTVPSAPQTIGQKPMTPALFRKRIGVLNFVKRAGKRPLLFARVKAKKGGDPGTITVPRLRAAQRPGSKGPFVAVPIFVALDSVTVRKRLHITGIVRAARDRLSQLYASLISHGS